MAICTSLCQSDHAQLDGRLPTPFVYGHTSWNSLPDGLNNVNLTLQTFKRHLKTFVFPHLILAHSAHLVSIRKRDTEILYYQYKRCYYYNMTDSVDSLDCLPILLTISVFLLFSFSLFAFLVLVPCGRLS